MKSSITSKLILTIPLGGSGAIGKEGEMADMFLIISLPRREFNLLKT
jgi:hypothetical protein